MQAFLLYRKFHSEPNWVAHYWGSYPQALQLHSGW